MLRNGTRIFPKLNNILLRKYAQNLKVQTPMISARFDHHGRRFDPFTQMESFMKDLEKKFWGEVNHNFPRFPRRPKFGFPSESAAEVTRYSQGVWGPSDLSTSNRFKFAFNFPNAKPEDVKVTLKDRLISIEAKVEESSENTKMNQSYSFQYTLPESVDVEALESVLSHEGVLTIEAPKTPSEAPKTINIKRE